MGVENHLNIRGSAGVSRPRSSANKVKPGQKLVFGVSSVVRVITRCGKDNDE